MLDWKGLKADGKEQRTVSAKMHICKVYLKDGGWLDSSQSVPAAIAKYQRLGGLQKFILKAGKPKIKERMASVAVEGLLPVHRWCLLAVSSHSEEARELLALWDPFNKDTDPHP